MKTQPLFQRYSCLKPGLKINFLFSTLWGCVSSLIRLLFLRILGINYLKYGHTLTLCHSLGYLQPLSPAAPCAPPARTRPPQLTTIRTSPPNAFPLPSHSALCLRPSGAPQLQQAERQPPKNVHTRSPQTCNSVEFQTSRGELKLQMI